MTCSLTLFIKASKATGSVNSFTLSIPILNLLKYIRINSPSYQATLKSFVEVFLVSMLVLKRATSFAHRLLKPLTEFGSRLLY